MTIAMENELLDSIDKLKALQAKNEQDKTIDVIKIVRPILTSEIRVINTMNPDGVQQDAIRRLLRKSNAPDLVGLMDVYSLACKNILWIMIDKLNLFANVFERFAGKNKVEAEWDSDSGKALESLVSN